MQFLTIQEEKYDTKLHQMISAFKVKRMEIIQSRLSTHLNPLNKDLPMERKTDDDDSYSGSSSNEESKSDS
jgi:hypothetical protein